MQVQNIDVPNTNGQKQTFLLAWRILWCTDEPLQSVFFKSWAQILSWNFKLGLRIKCQLDLFPSLQKSPMHGTLGQGGGYKCRLRIFPPAQILCLGWNHYKQYDSLFGNQRLLLVLINWYDQPQLCWWFPYLSFIRCWLFWCFQLLSILPALACGFRFEKAAGQRIPTCDPTKIYSFTETAQI